jgi:hypothetical protein
MQLPEKLKARDDTMRAKVHVRQQQRRRQLIERRQRQIQQQKLRGGAAPTGKDAGKPEAGERREQRLEKRGAMTPAEKRQQRLERREGKAVGEPAGPARAGGAAKTPAERRQERREGRQVGNGKQAAPAVHKPSDAVSDKTRGGKGAQQKGKNNKPDETAVPPKAQKGKPDQGNQTNCKDDKKKKKDKKDKCGSG